MTKFCKEVSLVRTGIGKGMRDQPFSPLNGETTVMEGRPLLINCCQVGHRDTGVVTVFPLLRVRERSVSPSCRKKKKGQRRYRYGSPFTYPQ